MSDVPQGPTWWQASDNKWYPPELHPSYLPSPPPRPNYVRSPTGAPNGAPTPGRRTLTGVQWFQAGAVAFGCLGLLMSWATVFIVSVSGLDTGDGRLFGVGLIFAAVCLIWRISAASGIAGVLLTLTWVVLLVFAIYEIGHITSTHILGIGSGLYVDIVATVVGGVASVVDLLTIAKGRPARPK